MAYPRDRYRIYKSISLGGSPTCSCSTSASTATVYGDGLPKHIIGDTQYQWLLKGLTTSTARWKVIAQQVAITADPFGTAEAFDQWDGFPEDRTRLLGAIEQAGLRDVVFITGDAHVFMANLPGERPRDVPAATPSTAPARSSTSGGSDHVSRAPTRNEADVQAAKPRGTAVQRLQHGYAHMRAAPTRDRVPRRRHLRPDGATSPVRALHAAVGLNTFSRQTIAPPA